jgi:hypothetical protein
MALPLLRALLVLSLARPAFGQNQTIWSSVVITTFGDRVPLLSTDLSVLTPLGAQQLYSAGQDFRGRYVSPSDPAANGDYAINGISLYEMDPTQTVVMTVYDIFIQQSAAAFLQGLYPPFDVLSANGSVSPLYAQLANGTTVQGPLGGIQYPITYIASPLDGNYAYLAGMDNCPAYQFAADEYLTSAAAVATAQGSAAFYESLKSTVFSDDDVVSGGWELTYDYAYEIWDFVSYQYIHNATVNNMINQSTVDTARYLADQFVWQTTANFSTDGGMRAIAGGMLANRILDLLADNINTTGSEYKLNLLFTSFEPIMGIASLMNATALDPDFFGECIAGRNPPRGCHFPISSCPKSGSLIRSKECQISPLPLSSSSTPTPRRDPIARKHTPILPP